MMIIYFDASVLIKEFHTEKGTEIISFVFKNIKRSVAVTSLLSISEVVSAFRRKLKANVINRDDYETALSSFLKGILDRFILGDVDSQIVHSLLLIDEYGLKAADAIHLSTANNFREKFKPLSRRFVFITSDVELVKATKKEGFIVINPEKDTPSYVKKIFSI